MRAVLIILMIVSVGALSGCIPYRFTARTGTSGAVTDARTGMAVTNAVIILSSGRTSQGPFQFSTNSDVNGMFHIDSEHSWGILPLGPFDPARWHTRITIAAPGYISYCQTNPCTTLGPSVIMLPDVKLEHTP
jgi:hypothetical protein